MRPAILVHGGAGAGHPEDLVTEHLEGCLAAARLGFAVLRGGGSALEAVEVAARALEDDPLFNAGHGSALNADGEVELDASVMDGRTLAAGAVAALRCFPNPVRIARAVMEQTGHVLLCGSGAEHFARAQGFAACEPGALITARARERWARGRPSHGTIGAVAIDSGGHLAAATSTGGTAGKLAGRIGDSALIGAGTYADDTCGAASMTGHGESIIKRVLAKRACDLLGAGESAPVAASRAIAELARGGGEGGIILVDRLGRLGVAFNTARMSRAWIDPDQLEGAGFFS